ncbi:hypothetical protein EVAR_83407_1 [Eumeta japonica]|uniref:Uncharacterized protein n=1 Tax=Eumeta variegata TaxID=151549 RepID=A0A4C1TZ51_EUMVA|nr:hypothetical protein EVAR_83407_1 [Eumeta japonica]
MRRDAAGPGGGGGGGGRVGMARRAYVSLHDPRRGRRARYSFRVQAEVRRQGLATIWSAQLRAAVPRVSSPTRYWPGAVIAFFASAPLVKMNGNKDSSRFRFRGALERVPFGGEIARRLIMTAPGPFGRHGVKRPAVTATRIMRET